LCNFRLLDVTL